ncbi:hypothetical protein [Sinomonas sp.]|uniref:hypothetical protein n=1 Tax=Sinomonas sp. TaxID=1914986 RepID=UPI003F7EE3D4
MTEEPREEGTPTEGEERLDGLQRDTGIASDKGNEKAEDLEDKAYGGDDDTPDVPLPG